MDDIIDRYNAVTGGIIAVLAAIFGEFWFLFALYFLFQIMDWLTGWHKAYLLRCESSRIGFAGILKKLGYWAVITVGFGVSFALKELSERLGLQGELPLNLTMGIGWFVLATLTINEARSILENLVEVGYNVPVFLVKGLAVTDRLINNRVGKLLKNEEDK